jgi:hypothetical protein
MPAFTAAHVILMRFSTYDKVNLIAAYHLLVGGLYLVVAAVAVILPLSAILLNENAVLARLPGWLLGMGLLSVSAIFGLIGIVNLTLGWGLWQVKPWSRMAAMVAAIFRLPAVPVGTIAGGVILYVLLQDETRDLFVSPPPG